ncbi:MAG: hypothetical protein K6F25_04615 [Bacteroidales bacterium]|nr:hypothetical protein [Bacteroidales bacterium]
MIALATVLTLLCFALMFLVDREYKIAILFAGTMLLTLIILPFKGMTAMMVMTLGFIISEIPYFRIHWRRILKSVVFPYSILVLVAFLLAVITSPHLHNINDLGYFALSEVMVKQLALVYGFLALRKGKSIQPLIIVSFCALILMTLTGYFNYVTGSSFFVDSLSGEMIEEHDYLREQRFRVQATFFNPFDYGYICVLLAVIHLYGYLQKMESTTMMAIAQACCLFGVLTCNCRTVFFCYVVCALVFVVSMHKDMRMKIIITVSAAVTALALVMIVPAARKTLFSVLSIFDTSPEITGSSLGMRLLQFTTVIYYIRGPYLLFGRGVHFFELDLGWENGSALAVDSSLYGLEGIYLNLLLERGIMGFVLYLAVMTLIVVFIIRHRRFGCNLYSLGITVLILYLLFSFMTGELLSATPSFYILGYVLSNQTRRERFIEWRKKQCRA